MSPHVGTYAEQSFGHESQIKPTNIFDCKTYQFSAQIKQPHKCTHRTKHHKVALAQLHRGHALFYMSPRTWHVKDFFFLLCMVSEFALCIICNHIQCQKFCLNFDKFVKKISFSKGVSKIKERKLNLPSLAAQCLNKKTNISSRFRTRPQFLQSAYFDTCLRS